MAAGAFSVTSQKGAIHPAALASDQARLSLAHWDHGPLCHQSPARRAMAALQRAASNGTIAAAVISPAPKKIDDRR
eukprot:scaffold29325_cov127-Isochrysis_galbana.AAC.2